MTLRLGQIAAAACALLLAACISSRQPKLTEVYSAPEANVTIASDGAVAWNGIPIASDEELNRCMRIAAAITPKPKVRIRPSTEASYKSVARVLAAAQRANLTSLGFTANVLPN